jgi:KamA family protein
MPTNALEKLSALTGQSAADLKNVAEHYPFAVTPFLARRAQECSYSAAALRQFVPDVRELLTIDGFTPDPTGEAALRPESAILRTYDNRLAIMLTYRCLVYCRFCFRKSQVGMPGNAVSDADLDRAIAYIAEHSEIEDVLLSGGDPLAMPNRRLIPFLRRLTAIEHLHTIRIDSRALNVHPERIDDELIDFLARHDHFWYYAHLNHPDDIEHPAVLDAVRRLLTARVPVLNQCVFLAGVNDDVATMTRLMNLCYKNKVIPYNLYVFDRVAGGAHFDVPAEKIVEIYMALTQLSGPAQPLLVYVGSDSRKRRIAADNPVELHRFLASRPEAGP